MHRVKPLAALFLVLILTTRTTGAPVPPVGLECKPLAKNVILMISDGWSINHIQAASYYASGKDAAQAYTRFPSSYTMSTYTASGEYNGDEAWRRFGHVRLGATDSAAAATALSTGAKTQEAAIGVDQDGNPLVHTMQKAEACAKSTGVVSSVQFSHATPAGFIAHNISRNNYADIAKEMIYASAADVIMGAGHPCYSADGEAVPCARWPRYVGGPDTWTDLSDGRATGADANGDGVADEWTVIQTREDFQKLAQGETPDRVLGIAQVAKTLQQGRSGDLFAAPYVVPQIETVPTLAEMARAALNVLDNDDEGFHLMVEGGAVDWASHANQSGRMIEEQIDFDNAVDAVIEWVKANSSWDETLLIVTGDHETSYLTGPGSDPEWLPIENNGAGVLPGIEWHSTWHTNSLIPIYAQGDAARLLDGYADQYDPVRGRYLDNTDIALVVLKTLGVVD